ncbi:MAG: GNAT family N-acetyltransferase [Bacteroidota bacterium]
MSATLKPATLADLAEVHRLAHIVWPPTFSGILSATQIDYMLDMMYSIDALRQQVEERGHVFHLLQEGDKNVGYVSHQIDYLPGTTKIHKLYALPDYQGRGHGRFMVDRISDFGRAAGQHTLRLDVNYQNNAIGFYQKLGFEIVERIDTDIGHGYLMEDYVMERRL